MENFSLTIEKGERVGIIGKSGSGKTTLLKLITGMLKPSKGQVSFSGIDLQDIDIFIFDEATSILDQYSESIVQDNSGVKESCVALLFLKSFGKM